MHVSFCVILMWMKIRLSELRKTVQDILKEMHEELAPDTVAEPMTTRDKLDPSTLWDGWDTDSPETEPALDAIVPEPQSQFSPDTTVEPSPRTLRSG